MLSEEASRYDWSFARSIFLRRFCVWICSLSVSLASSRCTIATFTLARQSSRGMSIKFSACSRGMLVSTVDATSEVSVLVSVKVT